MTYLLTVEVNAEGDKLACFGKGNKQDGWTGSGCYRLAGPKAWGGSKAIAKLEISEGDLIRCLKSEAPELIAKLLETN